MRHGVKLNHLGRTAAHRKALLSGLACELILHKRIITTLAKAKALRVYAEPLLTKSKTNTTHQRRVVFSYLNDKHAVTELFTAVSEKIAARPGGYTRIIKLGKRLGDAAEMAMIELVDFNEVYVKEGPGGGKKRRTRRSGGGKKKQSGPAEEKKAGEAGAEPAATEQAEEAAPDETPSAETEAPAAETPAEKPAEAKADKEETKAKKDEKSKKDEAPEA